MSWPDVAVVGPGAVGCFFGGMLARAGAPVTLYARPGSTGAHLTALRERGVEIDGVSIHETIPVGVTETGPGLAAADLVLVAVKSMDTDVTGRQIRDHLRPGALVVSLQNGIDNVERLEAAGVAALPAVVFVAAAIERPGTVRHRGRGDLVIGAYADRAERRADAERIAAWFEAAGVPCPVADDIRRQQWIKLTLNSMTNATSALTGASYRRLADFAPTWELALAIAREAIAVAAAEGTMLDLDEIVEKGLGIVRNVGDATSSTQQDIAAGRRTEIDALNGYISRRGAELGVATPTNEALTALLKLREELPA
jgi:2-dehydropantoate 2-reductase